MIEFSPRLRKSGMIPPCRACWGFLLGATMIGLAAVPPPALSSQADPTVLIRTVQPLFRVQKIEVQPVDPDVAWLEDAERDRQGLPSRFALPRPVLITPGTHGTWEELSESARLWRLRISALGAMSLNLGFSRYRLPPGAHLFIYDAELEEAPLHFFDKDNKPHGQLWTPVVLADDIVLELTVPVKLMDAVELELTSVNVGYRFFGERRADKAGPCNIDVVCPEGDGWRDEIQSVAVYSIGGHLKCTGVMVNNTAQDETPYFLTADHCGLAGTNAWSVVVYWNFQSPNCGEQDNGPTDQAQEGSVFLASSAASDFALLRLDDPPDPAWNVAYAGWDRSDVDPESAVAIHHPNTDEKSISFEYDPCTTTDYLAYVSPGDGTHIRVTDWDLGTTEPGSSGSPLFDQNHHVVGQLHGGYAACDNDLSDWYGRLSVSWAGGGTDDTRLSNWLDPIGSQAMTVDLLAPGAAGMRLTPSSGLTGTGDEGGPFTPASVVFTVQNRGVIDFNYLVTAHVGWIDIINGSGTVPGQGSAEVTVQFNANALDLPVGLYTDDLTFTNLNNHDGDTTRRVSLQVGQPRLVYSFGLDSDPGWQAKGKWAFGQPAGGGGEHGGPDPTSGFTGGNVYGYNLTGDYKNSLQQEHLTSKVIDCSDLSGVTLKFRRWLGVETSLFDNASVSVSNNGINFQTVWQNSDEIADTAWQLMEFDISAIADGQPDVNLRWTMGPTDGSWTYCGWNIDDIEIWALDRSATGVVDRELPARTALLSNAPNPFNPLTEIRFDIAQAGPVRLAIYDLRGRLIRLLLEEFREVGRHGVVWDGKDRTGRAVGSGAFVAILQTDNLRLERKLTLVR